MDLSIIIVNWNTKDLLQNCLRSIAAGSEHYQVEVIVADNNSADGSRDMVAANFPKVKLFNSGANLGFAKANNLGLRHAQAPLILYLNPDTELGRDSLDRMINFMSKNSEVGALGCKIRNASGSVQRLGLQWFPSPLTQMLRLLAYSERSCPPLSFLFPCHDPEISGYVKMLYGACLLVRRAVLDQVGGFDERFFMYCEDVDLCQRIQRGGWRLFYLAEAEILHLGGSSSSNTVSGFSVLMMCESCASLNRKYYGRLGSIGYRLVTALGAPARLLLLLCLRTPLFGRRRLLRAPLDASIRKYQTATRWALGLEKPIIRA